MPTNNPIDEIFDYADPNHPTDFWRKKRAKTRLLTLLTNEAEPLFTATVAFDEFEDVEAIPLSKIQALFGKDTE